MQNEKNMLLFGHKHQHRFITKYIVVVPRTIDTLCQTLQAVPKKNEYFLNLAQLWTCVVKYIILIYFIS